MASIYPQFGKDSESPKENEPSSPNPARIPWSTRVKEAALGAKEVAGNVYDYATTRPSKRPNGGNEGREADALGSGKEWYNDLEYFADLATAAGSLGGSVLGVANNSPLIDGEFVKGAKAGASRLSRFARTGANMGAGIVGGYYAQEAGDAIAERQDDTSDLDEALAAARYYGDDDTISQIAELINQRKTRATNTRTLANGLAVGMSGGTAGTLVGAGTASLVNAARGAIGGEMHMSHDAKFMKDFKARENQAILASFDANPEGKSQISPNDAMDALIERVARGRRMEADLESSLPDERTIDAIFGYMKKQGFNDPEFMKKMDVLGNFIEGKADIGIPESEAQKRRDRISKFPSQETLRQRFSKN
jgi:hypothetical protein